MTISLSLCLTRLTHVSIQNLNSSKNSQTGENTEQEEKTWFAIPLFLRNLEIL